MSVYLCASEGYSSIIAYTLHTHHRQGLALGGVHLACVTVERVRVR